MDGEQKAIDNDGIQETVSVWDCTNGRDGLAILEARESIENGVFTDWKAFQREWIV